MVSNTLQKSSTQEGNIHILYRRHRESHVRKDAFEHASRGVGKPIRLVYLAFIRLPTEKAHGVQIMKTCEAFAGAGAEVELIVPGRKTPIEEEPFAYYDVKKNFTLTPLATPDWVGWGRLGFILSSLWFSEAAKWRKSFWNADVVYSRDAFVLLQYLLLGRKLVYEAHTKPTPISKFVAKKAYKLIVISEGLRDAYIQAGVDQKKIIVAHDAVDVEAFKKHYDQKESRAWLGIPQNKKVALYVGRLDSAKGADTFAAVSEHLPDTALAVLIGAGPLTEALKEKYPKALFLPETPYRELPRVLSVADVLVLPNSAQDIDAALYSSPLKAFAYLATGKPIIASDVPALRAVLKHRATYVAPNNAKALANKIFSAPGLSGQERAYSWKERAQDILNAVAQ